MFNQSEILTNVQQYRYELSCLPRLTSQEENEISTLARAGGEQARARLIENCLRYIAFIAARYKRYVHHDDYLDLVGVGNLAVVEHVEKALTVDNPHAYLFAVAKCEIITYCMTRASLITRSRYTPIAEMYVESLDAPLHRDGNVSLLDRLIATEAEPGQKGEESDYTDLYSALDALPERQREVLTRHYGLRGHPAESLYEMSRELTANPGPKSCVAYMIEYRALARLRQHLEAIV